MGEDDGVADDSLFDDVSWELREVINVALLGDDRADLVELPHSGRIEQLRRIDDRTLGAVVTWGDALYYVARIDTVTHEVIAAMLSGQPPTLADIRAALAGSRVLLVGRDRGDTVTALATLDGTDLRWPDVVGRIPEPITAFDACLAGDGELVAYAGGSRLWQWQRGAWVSVHDVASAAYVRSSSRRMRRIATAQPSPAESLTARAPWRSAGAASPSCPLRSP